jgi:uncharacterized protein YndB with AHSA1/START domain
MKTFGLIVGSLIGILVLAGVVMAVVGSRLPREHSVSRTIALHRSPGDVYAAIRDFASAPTWRKDVKRVTLLEGTPLRFREDGGHGSVTYEVVDDVPGQRLVTRIVDEDLGYSGRWTYALEPTPDGTRLRITEDGEVSNVMFRFLSRYVFGHTATIDGYLAALAAHLEGN